MTPPPPLPPRPQPPQAPINKGDVVYIRCIVDVITPNEHGDHQCSPTDRTGKPTMIGRYLYIHKNEIITKAELRAHI
jgi:hypothetical protein